jgi:hypothetical protein
LELRGSVDRLGKDEERGRARARSSAGILKEHFRPRGSTLVTASFWFDDGSTGPVSSKNSYGPAPFTLTGTMMRDWATVLNLVCTCPSSGKARSTDKRPTASSASARRWRERLLIRFSLLAFTSHPVVPIHECSLGVVPPGPDMEFEERWYVESIRAVDK